MDKYNSKIAFQKWVSSINLNNLSEEAKRFIKKFDYYSKKLDFRTTLKVLFHAVYEELPRYREIDRAFLDPRLCKEIGMDPLCHSLLSWKNVELSQEILIKTLRS